ncbi:[FeFe] hydrogenase H-cluster radical SAM maturase HydE [Sutterella sp.]|uniref:[FeFe] hydrogenase H-cluster radical SAM maturase HydE n=1 Tax=Sutterella sp. TaxID=1981025 RepID=UPI0026E022AA|nr:[FeFe] hydrogenase H-cluster radical SAM maturase HydE [Sutterella sp.]MDO5531888.1 [FeFe] hydrogenase H-cluster radical SAM maturase HydE [Sutterella sp.]
MTPQQLAGLLKKPELNDDDIVTLLGLTDPGLCGMLRDAAFARTTELLGPYVYYRGLIELSNICTANCRYCGIRKANHAVKRYTMTQEEIVEQAVWAARNGYGSVCLQSGERHDEKFIEFICSCLREIHEKTKGPLLPKGVGVTLSLGDQEEEVYRRWAEACGNPESLRYLARFETSNPKLFAMLHSTPGTNEKNLEHRFACLRSLRRCGYQVGSGVMIGIPGQTLEDLAHDIRTFQEIDVDMIGMGPYLRSEGNDLESLGQMEPRALLQLALNMIAVTRLVMGPVNIAAATALQAIRDDGREMGIEYGCNIVMPNLSPQRFRKGYQLYDNKPCLDDEPTHCASCLEKRIESRGRSVGWNMSGSSRHYLRRMGRPDEVKPAKDYTPDGKRLIRLRAI